MKSSIEVCLLGTVEIKCDGKPVNGFESRKALALCCYIIERQKPILRSHLVDLFWGDKEDARGRSNLSRVLHNNSVLLPDVFQVTRSTVQLSPAASIFLDVAYFDDLIAHNDLPSLIEAIELCRGEFMEDIVLDNCPDFDTWLTTERELWNQRHIQALAKIVSFYRNSGQYQDGIDYAHQLLNCDPWREETYREMMLMLVLNGERSAALAQYEKCSRILADDLGIKPNAETTALYYRIRANEIQYQPHPLCNPLVSRKYISTHPSTTYPAIEEGNHEKIGSISTLAKYEFENGGGLHYIVNRSEPHHRQAKITTTSCEEFTEILDRLTDPTCHLLTLVGKNSVSQLQLLNQVVESSMLAFRDGIYWVPQFSSYANSLLCDIVDSLGIALSSVEHNLLAAKDETQVIWLYKLLRSRELLLVFRDVERYGPDVHLLDAIIKRSPKVKILASGRQPINVNNEWIFDV